MIKHEFYLFQSDFDIFASINLRFYKLVVDPSNCISIETNWEN